MSTYLHALWSLAVAQLTGRLDVVFGSVTSGRPPQLRGATEMVGLFINTVPVRVSLHPGESGAAFLARLHDELWSQRPFEHAALSAIQAWSPVDADHSLFETLLVVENYPVSEAQAAESESLGLVLRDVVEHPHYPLTVVAIAHGGEMQWLIDFDRSRFRVESIERLGAQLLELAEEMVRNDEAPALSLSMLSASERDTLVRFADGARPAAAEDASRPDSNRSVHRLFEAQVRETPHAVAMRDAERTWTYAELNALANQHARRIARQGIGVEDRVGLAMPRSPEFVVAALATLKVGAAYVPLDPDYPRERLRFMAEEAAIRLLLMGKDLDTLAELDLPRLRIACELESGDDARSMDDLEVEVSPDNIAYVIFTSGSTGVPKGSAVRHGSIANLAVRARIVDIGPQDVVGFASNVSFDAATFELWTPLLSGASLAVLPLDVVLDAERLTTQIERDRVTILWMTAGLFHQNAKLDPGMFGRLRYLLSGGEALDPGLVGRVLESPTPPRVLINGYGPTETTTFATTHPVRPRARAHDTVPIGRPFPGVAVHVLDDTLHRRPLGLSGELYIGGEGLARGYWNQPARTAERFVPNPFGLGMRLYRTGDRVRWLDDGSLEFLGRQDSQIKLRGYRIELGEIRAALLELESVEDALVEVRGHGEGRRIVAYVEAPSEEDAGAELRTWLATVLPEFMVPSAIVRLPAFPLTPNGKIDRKALPDPGGHPEDRATYVAPQGPREVQIAQLWSELLGGVPVGAHDNFFSLGGNSLLVAKASAQLRRRGLSVSIRDLYRHPTPALLAAAATVEVGSRSASPGGELRTGDREVPFLIRRWVENAAQAVRPEDHVPWHSRVALEFQGALDRGILERVIERLTTRHEIFRASFPRVDAERRYRVGPPPAPSLRVVDLRELPMGERERAHAEALREDHWRIFDLESGPLYRFTLFLLDDANSQLVLVVHHLIWDLGSTPVLTREVSATYAAFARGEEPALGSVVSYGDAIEHWIEGFELPPEGAFAVPQGSSRLPLPFDDDTGETGGGVFEAELPPAMVRDLATQVAQGETWVSVASAVWASFLAALLDRENVHFEGHLDIRGVSAENALGCYIQPYRCDVSLPASASFRERIAVTRDALADMYDEYYIQPGSRPKRPWRVLPRDGTIGFAFEREERFADLPATGDLRVQPRLLPAEGESGDELHLDLVQLADGRIRAFWRYARNRLREETVARWHELFCAPRTRGVKE